MAKQINTVLSMKDKMSQPLVKVSKNVGKVTREMKKSQNQVNRWGKKTVKTMDNVIKKTAKIGGAIAVAGGTIAIKVGFEGMKELDSGAAKVKSIARESLDLKDIQKDLLKNSTDYNIKIDELADTQYSAISAGVKAIESMDAAISSNKLAVGGFTDTNSALKLLTSTMNTYGLEGTEAMDTLSDKMMVTQNKGVTTVQELSGSLGDITPIAKSAGVSIDDMLSSVASLTKGGMSTSSAVTNLKGVMTSFIKPTDAAAKKAKELGIDMSVAAIKNKGFGKVMEEIKEKTGGNTEVMAQLFGNVRALNGALALTSDEGMKNFNETMEEMKDSAGATDEAYETMTNTIGFKFDKMKNRVKNTFTEMMNSQSGAIGEQVDKMDEWLEKNQEKINEWVQSIAEGVGKMVDLIKGVVDFIKKHEKAITTIMVFVMSMYTVVKVIQKTRKVMKGLSDIGMILNGALKMTPLSWLILSIGLVITALYALYRNWDKIKEKLNITEENIASFKETISVTLDAVKDVIFNFATIVWENIKKVGESFKPLIDTIKDIFGQLMEILKGVMPFLMPILEFIAGVFVGRIVWAFQTIMLKVQAVVQGIAGVLDGLLTILSGVLDFVIGVFTGNWSRAWDGIKNIVKGIVKIMTSVWGAFVDFISAPVSAFIDVLDSAFHNKLGKIRKAWQGLKNFMKHPIKGTVNIFKKTKDKITGKKTPAYAKGTSYSPAGYARIHEEGGEIRRLSSGETIIPADKSDRLLSNKGTGKDVKIDVQILGNVIGNKQFANEVGEEVYTKVKFALENM